MEGRRLTLWQSAIAALILIPLFPYAEFPANPMFYLCGIFVGISAGFGSAVIMNLSAQKNGRVSCMYLPLQVIGAFVLWSAIEPSSFITLLENPISIAGVSFCLMLAIAAAFIIRGNDVSWQSFKMVLPVGFIYGISIVVCKIGLQEASTVSASITFMAIVWAVMFVVSLAHISFRPNGAKNWMPKGMLKAACILAVIVNISYGMKLVAIMYAPNPAYAEAMRFLAPVWLMVYYFLTRQEDDASPRAGLALAASGLGIVIFTNL